MGAAAPSPAAAASGRRAARALRTVALLLCAEAATGFFRGAAPLELGPLRLPARRSSAELALAGGLGAAALAVEGGLLALGQPAAVFLWTAGLGLSNTRLLSSGDTASTALVPFAVLRRGSLALDEIACPGSTGSTPAYFLVRAEPHLLSKYPVATGLLALPAYLPAALGRTDPCAPAARDVEKLAAAVLGALGAALVAAALRRLLPPGAALGATLIYVAGTAVQTILTQALWQHTGAAVGSSLAVYALACRSGRAREALVGIGAGLAVACRPVDLAVAAALLLALAAEERSPLPALRAAGFAALPLFPVLLYDQRFFGSPLATGYGAEAQIGWRWGEWPEGALGLLVSPARGLFWFSPWLLLALRPGPRPGALARALPWLSAGFAAHLAVIAAWWAWHGAYAAGPRMHAEALPLIAPAAALGLARAWQARRWLAALLAGWSVALHLFLVQVPAPDYARRIFWDVRRGPWTWKAFPPVSFVLGWRGEEAGI